MVDYLERCANALFVTVQEQGTNGKYRVTGQSPKDAFLAAFATVFGTNLERVGGNLKSAGPSLKDTMFFLTKEGYFGFAPSGLKEEDVIVAFCGLPGLYIVRPVPGTLDFRLYSPCYIHGMMKENFEYSDDYQMIPLV